MEKLEFEFVGYISAKGSLALAGVVSSGNLEVMIEPFVLGGKMRIEIATATSGFAATWKAVLNDFNKRHPLRDVRVSINDFGATPAVVSLRLDQAAEVFEEGTQ